MTSVFQPQRPIFPLPDADDALREAVWRTLAQAEARGAPVLLRVHQDLEAVDPWRLLGHPALIGRQVFAWYDDASDHCFLGLESLNQATLVGEDRFLRANDEALATPTVEVDLDGEPVAAGVPVACAGFRFAQGPEASPQDPPSPWQGWEPGLLWFPHAVLNRRGHRTVLVVAETVRPGDTVDAILAELQRNRARILAHIDHRGGMPGAPATPALTGPAQGREPTAHAAWLARVRAARAQTREGGLRKVVLARSETWKAPAGTRFDAFGTAVALRERQARCTTFAFVRRDGSAFVSATPELLVRVNGGVVHSVALAGTLRRDPADPAQAERLLASEKDRHEQGLVTEAIRRALAEIADDIAVPERPEVIHLADLLHMETRISARLRPGHGLLALAGRLHPTPAVGGLPHAEAMRWIAANEGLDRGWYAAPVGWVDAAGDGVLVVALRSVLLRGDTAVAFAGCGIVPDSDAESEWQETLSKLQAVSRGLAVEPAR